MTEERKGATPAVCPTAGPIIEMRGIRKSYYLGRPNELEILHGIDLTVNAGEFLAIVGESGSGKSTLMNIIGALDKSTQGSYWLAGVDVEQAPDRELSAIRNKKIGFVFQTYNLIGRQSALKDVELPMLYAGVQPRQRPGGLMNCWPWWRWMTSAAISPTSFPAARNSGWPLPGPWPTTRMYCWPMSPPAPWTVRPAGR